MSDFVHLHNHSEYSILDSCCRIDDLIGHAKELHMPAIGLTDYGNLFGAAQFSMAAKNSKIKSIVGMEAYLAPSRFEKSKLIYHLVLFAKNQLGYQNLMALTTDSYLEGFFYKPRIDKELLRRHSAGLIATSSCLKGEIPQRLLHDQYDEAKKLAIEYLEIFPGNFYIEIQRHGLAIEEKINAGLLKIAAELNIPIVATNDIHYVKPDHAKALDVLLCIQTGKTVTDVTRPKYPGDSFYFKTPTEMKELFKDIPAAIENTLAIAESCDFKMEFGKSQLPVFALPEGLSENDYLRQLAEAGLRNKMGDQITPEMEARLNYELAMIAQMGFPGYFLVVQDLISAAREMGVSVGPGRGSAAGSLVSYATGITDVDPLKYQLLFERFLNPERISMPDIDIDFDDRNRGKVIEYVINKYGKDNVAQIITFGTMAARSVLRDVARALNIPLTDADRIAKLVPKRVSVTLPEAIKEVPELQALEESVDEKMRQLLEYSQVFEGLVRQPGIHAAGVVITPKPLRELIPVYKSGKDEISTQFDKDYVEKIGILKMDFLGLTTLSILDDAKQLIKTNHGVDIDLRAIPLDDAKTYELFAQGETVGIFQFESQGMTNYMKQLKPTSIEDLIAMNALYRPGPMEFIPTYINRKHGKEPVDCFHVNLEPILKPTYGVIVYQEQVMQVAQLLAGYTMGKADNVRRIMSKKMPEELAKTRPDWIEGCVKQGYTQALAEKIFDLLVPFSNYAFNKSHSAAYSIVAYQTAYLKANYPPEFMAAVLSSEMANIDRIATLINSCRDMGIDVLPPDVNESIAEFSVQNNTIRFGLGAVKNVGMSAIESIVNTRQSSGKFKTIFNLCEKLDLRLVNKKVLESLIQSGACDSLQGHRAQLFNTIEKAHQFGAKRQEQANSDQVDIFGNTLAASEFSMPPLAEVPPWAHGERLQKEKDLLGFYVSGHPLDRYRLEIESFGNHRIGGEYSFKDGDAIRVGGMILEIRQIFDKKGNPMAFVKIESFGGTIESVIFASVMRDNAPLLRKDNVILMTGKASIRNDALTIICESIIPIQEIYRRHASKLTIHINPDQMKNGKMDALKELLEKNRSVELNLCELFLAVEIEEKNVIARYKVGKYKIQPSYEFYLSLQNLLGRGTFSITTN